MMKKVLLAVSIVVVFCFFPSASFANDPAAGTTLAGGDYIIGVGDVLFVSVWKDPALTQSVPVRPDGRISFPLIGEIQAGGRSVVQLKEEMESKISRYVPDPVLTIGIQEIRSMFIYVVGRVNSPGRFAIHGNVDVLQALSMAGGCNPFAASNKIQVFRKEGGGTRIMAFNYDRVASGKNLEQNITLERGDVIVVP
jgi:polysaccharide biosynthesis/export protein